jgi:hypothetical protein
MRRRACGISTCYRRADVAASSKSAAPGSSKSATTSTNHRKVVSLSAPTKVARSRNRPYEVRLGQ